jgi:hypothetical protein
VALKVPLFMVYSPRVSSDGRFQGTDLVSIAIVYTNVLRYWITLINDILDISRAGKNVI